MTQTKLTCIVHSTDGSRHDGRAAQSEHLFLRVEGEQSKEDPEGRRGGHQSDGDRGGHDAVVPGNVPGEDHRGHVEIINEANVRT